MAKVTMHKSSDGQLHETKTACAKHEVAMRVTAEARPSAFNNGQFTVEHSGNTYLRQEDLADWIAINHEALRNILNNALVARRPRKTTSKEMA